MENKIDMEFVFKVCKVLKERFKGIESLPYGYCCGSDYYAYTKKEDMNDTDYVSAKVYKDGLNNDYNYDTNQFELGESVYFSWGLQEFDLDTIIAVMQEVANDYNYKVIRPKDKNVCLVVTINKEK